MFDQVEQANVEVDDFVWPSNAGVNIQVALGRSRFPTPALKYGGILPMGYMLTSS